MEIGVRSHRSLLAHRVAGSVVRLALGFSLRKSFANTQKGFVELVVVNWF
jgi:hypothetical protein